MIMIMMIYLVPSSVTLPFSQAGITIERSGSYVKIQAKLGLVIMWNEENSLWVCRFLTYIIHLNLYVNIYDI